MEAFQALDSLHQRPLPVLLLEIQIVDRANHWRATWYPLQILLLIGLNVNELRLVSIAIWRHTTSRNTIGDNDGLLDLMARDVAVSLGGNVAWRPVPATPRRSHLSLVLLLLALLKPSAALEATLLFSRLGLSLTSTDRPCVLDTPRCVDDRLIIIFLTFSDLRKATSHAAQRRILLRLIVLAGG